MNGDEVLLTCNETELIQMAREQGLPPLRRGLPIQDLVAIVTGNRDPREDEVAATAYTRKKLEEFIQLHWERVANQLPGCNGRCTTYPCSDGRHILCFEPNKDVGR